MNEHQEPVIPEAARDPAEALGAPEPERTIHRVARETEILDVFRSSLPMETIAMAFARREQELRHLFAALTIDDARVLYRRLSNPSLGDALAAAFSRMIAERRQRLLAFLLDARRRAALGYGRAE